MDLNIWAYYSVRTITWMNKLFGGQKTQLGVTMGNRGTLNQENLLLKRKSRYT